MSSDALVTLKVRVKDKHAKTLERMSFSVNFVWNYINELSYNHIIKKGAFLSANEIQKYTQGCNKELGLHSHTVQRIGSEYVIRRWNSKKNKLSWRKSLGTRRSLGWIPVKSGASYYKDGCVVHNGHRFCVWDSYGLDSYNFRSSSFNQDARGRWYFNVVVKRKGQISKGSCSMGIDLGLKDIATCSDGSSFGAGMFYRSLENKLSKAQRAKNKKSVKNIHAKIANRRKDFLHKLSSQLVRRCKEVYVGNVKSSSFAKTKMSKSVNDAGWAMLKTMLSYKCDNAGVVFKLVNERYTTQTCSSCGKIPASSPKGVSGLGIREWACDSCGEHHDRDINAAKNILAVGQGRPVEGIAKA